MITATTTARNRRVEINFPRLHPRQLEIAQHAARFRVLSAGRRFGKSRLGSALCIAEALKGGRAWWIGPSYPVASVGWRMIKHLAQPVPGVSIRTVDKIVIFPSGGEVRIRSADNPDSLRGEGLNLAVLDECAFMKEATWTEAIRPALSDRLGRAIFISTPKGRNWFWHLWRRGLGDDKEWQSWQLPTSDNPYIDKDEIEAARQSLPELTFEQEYLAVFLENQGSVFRNISACMNAPQASADDHPGHRIVFGVDWGKEHDYTAVSVGCADCRVEVAKDRFNKIDYHFQSQRLQALSDAWRPAIIFAESNSMGTPIIEQLQRAGLPVDGFQTTAQTKPPLIENLALALERQEWQFINDPIWTGELEAFERQISPTTGRSQYSAPAGGHDDTVIARALMVRAASSYGVLFA